MSFRKRNAALARRNSNVQDQILEESPAKGVAFHHEQIANGVRASPADGRLTTSTGTYSLDGLLAGHAGLPLGHGICVEETGTTDYAGALLRCYAAEGVMQGHIIHVIGAGPPWIKELPAVVEGRNESRETAKAQEAERMKIAWRYERLGNVNDRARPSPLKVLLPGPSNDTRARPEQYFCHTFDLAKRLEPPSESQIFYHNIEHGRIGQSQSPFTTVLHSVTSQLKASSSNKVHRVVIPAMLSPVSYPPHASSPQHVLHFLHSLRSLLRQHAHQLTVMMSLSITLYPRTSGVVRWLEHLTDGVIELAPFPFRPDDYAQNRTATSGAATANEEKPQGMVKIHKLPAFHDKGGGSQGLGSLGDDLAFIVSRRKFVIKPFSLPPEDGDTEAQKGANGESGADMPAKENMEF